MTDHSPRKEAAILYERRERVALITFNRPDRLNAMTPAMRLEYLQTLRSADDDPEVGAIVVSGAGRGFCAGADFSALEEIDTAALDRAHRDTPRDLAMHLRTPLIAAVNGPAAGVGLAHALMADVRFAAAGAKWTTAFARLGLVAEFGTSWLLPRQVGIGRALDLLYTARPFTSEEALEWGLVQWVYPAEELLDRALAYAATVAAHDPHALATMRAQVHADSARPWEPAFAEMLELVHEALERPEFKARLTALRERRS